MTIRRRMLCLLSLVLVMLAGCGGGGSGTSTPTTYNLDHMISQYVRTKHDYNLKATSGSNSLSLHLSSVPGPTATFGTVTADTSAQTLEAFENGTLTASDTGTSYYLVNSYKELGFYNATTGYATVYASQHDLPTAANIGDSGSVAIGTVYYDTSFTSVYGHETDTWSLAAASGSNATFCADTTSDTVSGTSTESDCYTITPAGDVQGLTITLLVNGVEVTYQ